MDNPEMKTIAQNAIKSVEKFFRELNREEQSYLPSLLKTPGRWMANYDNTALGIFFLNNSALERVIEYQNNGWNPFPGLLIGESQKPEGSPVAIFVSGSCNFFSSNRISNMFSFCVSPGASFTVLDHFQEINDSSGQEFKYLVDLAFVLGIHRGEKWSSVESRLSELLNNSLRVWQNII
jgi:hypothetical protein